MKTTAHATIDAAENVVTTLFEFQYPGMKTKRLVMEVNARYGSVKYSVYYCGYPTHGRDLNDLKTAIFYYNQAGPKMTQFRIKPNSRHKSGPVNVLERDGFARQQATRVIRSGLQPI